MLEGLGQALREVPESSSFSLSDSGPEQDETCGYELLIEWHSPDDPFARPGDSGSLVYVVVNEKIVPLGIHIFSSSEGRSTAYLLSPWFDEISSWLDVDIRFCDPTECQHSLTSSLNVDRSPIIPF